MTGVALPSAVRAAFADMPDVARDGALWLRDLILAEAAQVATIGRIEEALRWGQPAFLTPETGAACSLRVGPVGADRFGLFVHCRTNLIEEFRTLTGGRFPTEGTRAVLFRSSGEAVVDPLRLLIRGALTYHLRKVRPDDS